MALNKQALKAQAECLRTKGYERDADSVSGPSWLDMKPRQFDTSAPDVQLAMFGADATGSTGPDLFDLGAEDGAAL